MQMTLSRIFVGEARLHFQRKGEAGFLKPARVFSSALSYSSSPSPSSSSSSSAPSPGKTAKESQSKKLEAAKEHRAVAVETFVRKYMEEHPGVFPKAAQVQKNVGGSWYILRDILTDLRGKMMCNPQIQKQIPRETLDVTVDTEGSVAIMTDENLDSSVLHESESRIQLSEAVTDPQNNEKNCATSPASHVTGEKSLGNIVKLEDSSASAKIVEPANICQQFDEVNSSTVVGPDKAPSEHPSYLIHLLESADVNLESGEKSHGNIVKSEDSSASAKLVEPVNVCRQLEEVNSSTVVGPDKDTKTTSEQLSYFTHQLESEKEVTRASGEGEAGPSEVILFEKEDHQPDKKVAISSSAPNGSSKVQNIPASSGSAQKDIGLADLFMRKMDGKAEEMTGKNNNMLMKSLDFSREATGDDKMRREEIRGLLNRIKELHSEPSETGHRDPIFSNRNDHFNKTGVLIHRSTSPFSLQEVYKKRHALSGDHITHEETNQPNENEKEQTEKVPFETFDEFQNDSDSDITAFEYTKPEPSPQSSLLKSKQSPKKNPEPFLFTEKGRDQNSVLLRFLSKSVQESDIDAVYGICGPIAKIHVIPSRIGSKFKDAYIDFKTKRGLQRALDKTDAVVGGADVFMEAASPLTNMPNRVLDLNLIGVPDVPTALVKNPTKTVMVKGLPRDLASHHLRDALCFCGGHISDFIMGSSSSVAYVEFETEDAKEKAIAASSVSVSGKHLSILRIDAPRTTVMRISNVGIETSEANVRSLCKMHGQIKKIVRRSRNTFDVHFKLAEWPNMVVILNSLNGLVINEHQWLAQPATVIPVEILQLLWSQPDGRRHVNALVQSLCRKLELDPINLAEVNDLAAQYYGKGTWNEFVQQR